jgi:Na+-driven multidrug efflux pump
VTNPFLQSTSAIYWLLIGLVILINVVIGIFVGNAAREKDRSFGSFFWFSFLLGFPIPALVVAALPFRTDDSRHPQNKRNRQS